MNGEVLQTIITSIIVSIMCWSHVECFLWHLTFFLIKSDLRAQVGRTDALAHLWNHKLNRVLIMGPNLCLGVNYNNFDRATAEMKLLSDA